MNAERKETFLQERRREAEISTSIAAWFREATYFENQFGRDAAEWTSNEIVTFLRYLSSASVQTLTACVNSFRIYADWCLVNGFLPGGQNHWYEMNTDQLVNYIDLVKFRKNVITREELRRAVNSTPLNWQDVFVIWGAFNGLTIRDMVLVRFNDLEGNELNFPNNRGKFKVTEELVNAIGRCRYEEEYVTYSSKHVVLQYEAPDDPENPLVFRRFSRVNQDASRHMSRRFTGAMAEIGLTGMTVKAMNESGRMEFIRQMNVPVEQAVVMPVASEHVRQFGKIQQQTVWVNTYGKILKEEVSRKTDIR